MIAGFRTEAQFAASRFVTVSSLWCVLLIVSCIACSFTDFFSDVSECYLTEDRVENPWTFLSFS